MKQLICTVITLSLTALLFGQQSVTTDIKTTFNSQVPGLLKKSNTPGLAIAVIQDGKLIFEKGFGFANVEDQKEITSTTGFNIGSISKTFTAWGIMKLVEDGKLDLDTPISKYLSRWDLPTSKYNVDRVTIRAILNHTAGLSVHGYPGFSKASQLPSLEESLNGKNGAVRDDEKVELIYEPQTKFKYSGGGYTILQLIIEEVTGTSFSSYMESTIFGPLQMKNTSFALTPNIMKHSATPYNEEGDEMYMVRFTAQAAAGLQTTLEDLILFANANLKENPVLSAKSMSVITTPTALANNDYALGYMVMDRFGFRMTGHAGSNDGWQSGMMFALDSDAAIILLSNGSNGKKVLMPCLQMWAQWHKNQL